MSGDDFLKVAGELIAPYLTGKKAASEALCRTIISRSYYGAYHMAVAYLVSLGLPSTSNHEIPKRWLVASGDPNAKKAGRLLEDLYSARRRADYLLSDPRAVSESRDLNFVKDQIEWARDVKSKLEACSVEPVRSAVKAGIEAYRQRTGGRR